MDVSEPVWSVAFGRSADGPFLAGACADGLIRLWDARSGDLLGPPLAGHTGSVLSIAVGLVGDGALIASCGVDGTVRLWVPDTDTEPRLLEGHVGGVRDLTFGEVDGRSLLASAGADGTVRLWDPQTGSPVHDPFRGHAGSALAVAFASRNGQPVLCSGGDDLTIRLWDIESGRPAMAPIEGHQGSVRALAASATSPGLLASASDDGTVRLWDVSDGHQTCRPLTGHTGTVRAVRFVGLGGTEVLASGGIDGTIRMWDTEEGAPLADLKTAVEGADLRDLTFGSWEDVDWLAAASGKGCVASPVDDQFDARDVHRAVLSRAAVVSADDSSASDLLGRRILARHLIGVIAQLTAPAAAGTRSSVVMSIDGRWGSGKTTLARVLIDELHAGPGSPVEPPGRADAGADRQAGGHRSPDTELVTAPLEQDQPEFGDPITIWFDAWRESAVAPHWWALAAAVHRGIRAERGIGARLAMTLSGVVNRVVRSPAAVAAVVVVTTVVAGTMLLRRSAPAQVEETLTTLAGTLTAVTALVAAAAVATRSLFWTSPVLGQMHMRSENNPLGEVADLVRSVRRWSPRTGPRSADHRTFGWFAATAGVVATALAVTFLLREEFAWVWITLGVFTGLVLIGSAFLAGSSSRVTGNRRPVILVVDDLDRCSARTVVAYLETIHTLLRDDPATGLRRRREPDLPPLVVLALADGRWIRAAFSSTYAEFEKLGSPVRSLGGDFLQKLFDHTVLVPELTADQARRMLLSITENPAIPEAVPADTTPPDSAHARQDVSPGGQSGSSPNMPTEPARDAATDAAATEAQAASSEDSTRRREEHLLSQYATIVPANPRLIRRVANAWAMLEALKLHLQHDQPDDVVVRAAILFVQYPSLVDVLLDATTPPNLNAPAPQEREEPEHPGPQGHPHGAGDVGGDAAGDSGAWARPDVSALLRRPDGTQVRITSVAVCFGKVFAGPDGAV